MTWQYANNNQMEIQHSHTEREHHSLPELSERPDENLEDQPMIQEPPAVEPRMTRSSNKSSELQNQGELKSVASRHKNIKKKTEKVDRVKVVIAKNKKIQKLKASTPKKAKDENIETVPVPSPTTNASLNSILNSIGYTFFTNHIDEYYLCKPGESHFQNIDRLLEAPGISTNMILNQTPEHSHWGTQMTENYLELIEITKRQEGQGMVVFKKESGENSKESLLVSYKIKEVEKREEGGEEEVGEDGEKTRVAMEIELGDVIDISSEELRLMEYRKQFMHKLEEKKAIYSSNTGKNMQDLSEISKELLFLNTYLSHSHNQNKKQIETLRGCLNSALDERDPEPVEALENRLVELVFMKNIRMSLERQEMDVMNYYKKRACDEENRDFIPFVEQRKMVQYMKKKRPTKSKKPKTPIHSACSACFSPYIEQSNPFSHCYDCSHKIHKNCRMFIQESQHCKLCHAKKHLNKKREFVECVLCPNKGFTFMKVGNSNVHAFCILITGKFKVQNEALEVSKQILEVPYFSPPCFICCKSYGSVYQCMDSDLSCHSTCAFLHGYDMDFKDDTLHIYSNTATFQERIKYQFYRRYRLNYQGTAYKYFSLEDYKRQLSGGTSIKNSSCKFSSSDPKDDIVEAEVEESQEEEEMFHEDQ